MILICRFRRSLATAQTNRFALRLARDNARKGQIVRFAGVYAYRTLVVLLQTEDVNEWSTGILSATGRIRCGEPVWQPGVSPGWEILIGRQDARRPHSQDGYAPQDSDAGQHQQLPKRQTEQQGGKNHENDADGLETKALSDGRN